ncbi:MAG: putative rane protein [Acidimicrobiales bacterium]|nr:putative rane protein [Acidimicrobiales bacterium]
MLSRLAETTVRRRRVVLVGAALLFVLAGAFGGSVAKRLSSGGFDDPSSEASRARAVLADRFGTGSPNLVFLVTATSGTVDSASVRAAGSALTKRLAAERGVDDVASYWSLGSPPPLRSKDSRQALVVARLTGNQNDVRQRVTELSPKYATGAPGIEVRAGGFAEVFRQVGTTIEHDLVRAEMIALPITLLLLLFVFRSAVAAVLPLLIGALSVVGTFVVLRLLSQVTEVSIFALNLTTAMGLGLAIDYSLFVVSRFREERRAGYPPDEAVVRTVRTAGRTIAFSALTVAASLCALLVFPLAFLRSFAYAGVAVAIIAGLCAVVVLPALLAALGERVDALAIRRRPETPTEEGTWHRIAMIVMRRPILIAGTATIVLLALGAPFLRLQLGRPDDRVLPKSATSRQVSDALRTRFSSREANALPVVAADTSAAGSGTAVDAAIDRYARQLAKLPGVTRVDARTGIYLPNAKVPATAALSGRFAGTGATWLSVVPSVEPVSADGERLVKDIRSLPAPFPVLVGGTAAELVDTNHALFARIPLAAGIVAVVTFVLLFAMFGSVVVPAKALVLNLLSLTATFGAMVWIFQDGHLSGLLHFTATGTLDATTPILMFCVAFGLSMDYEVFLLSRIKEEHDRGRPNQAAVATGLERTGRIVTAAALLIAVVFTAFATSQVAFIKLFGVGLTLAVLMDAFLIRGTLVPAFMRLAGEANWWAPRPLRRLHDRFGISEHVDLDADDAARRVPAAARDADGQRAAPSDETDPAGDPVHVP